MKDWGLGKRKRSLSGSNDPHETNLQANQTNSTPQDFKLEGQSSISKPLGSSIQDTTLIYGKIVRAVSKSVCYSLAKSGRYVPVSPGTFIARPIAHGFGSFAVGGTQIHPSSKPFSIGVTWLSTGTLIMVGADLNREYFPGNDSVERQSQLLLAPFGWDAKLDGSERHRDSLPEVTFDPIPSNASPGWRETLLDTLKLQGIDVSPVTRWMRAKFKGSMAHITRSIEWPEALCIKKDGLTSVKDRSLLDVNDDPRPLDKDPLSEAESWFLDKEKRKTLAKDRARSQLKGKAGGKADGSDEEDGTTRLHFRNDEHSDTLNVGGIYPTPPDGSRSQAVSGLGEQLESSPGQPGGSQMSQVVPTEARDDRPRGSADMNIGIGDYEHLEDDLFGDLRTDMGANNGITEDDFSFFDDPGSENLRRSTEQQRELDTKPQIEDHENKDELMLESPEQPIDEPEYKSHEKSYETGPSMKLEDENGIAHPKLGRAHQEPRGNDDMDLASDGDPPHQAVEQVIPPAEASTISTQVGETTEAVRLLHPV